MLKVYKSSVVNAPIDKVWAKIRDFNALPAWHPVIAESYIEESKPSDEVGCVRNFNLKDGSNIREKLLALSDSDYLCTYSMLESPLGLQNYVATLCLTEVTDGDRTFLEWSAEFECKAVEEQSMADLVGNGVFQEGFNGLKSIFEK